MRKLLPALFHRFLAGQIRLGSRFVGAAREPLDDDGYRAAVRVALGNASDHTPEQRDAFLGLIGYRALDARKDDGWDGLAGLLAERPDNVRVFYLSTSPELFVDICERLARHGLNQGAARVVLEKPIGRDLASANRINDDVGCVFAESQTYRIDHYLGKETVQNLLARSEEHTSELQSTVHLVCRLLLEKKKKKKKNKKNKKNKKRKKKNITTNKTKD